MNLMAALLLVTTVSLSEATTLVLKSGQTIEVSGPVRVENGVVVFRTPDETLYSISVAEVDLDATRAAPLPVAIVTAEQRLRLRVSEEEKRRLLEELSRNHSGRPAPEQRSLETPPPPPTREEIAQERGAEWDWRNRAREYEETVRRAKENLDLLIAKVEALRSHIASLISLGFKPNQFTYETTILQYTLELIPYAELEVRRAERTYAQFRDDARRQGVLPGWLR